jgi:hypothetical protein
MTILWAEETPHVSSSTSTISITRSFGATSHETAWPAAAAGKVKDAQSPTMETVFTINLGDLVFLAFHLEFGIGNSVRDPTNYDSKVVARIRVLEERRE